MRLRVDVDFVSASQSLCFVRSQLNNRRWQLYGQTRRKPPTWAFNQNHAQDRPYVHTFPFSTQVLRSRRNPPVGAVPTSLSRRAVDLESRIDTLVKCCPFICKLASKKTSALIRFESFTPSPVQPSRPPWPRWNAWFISEQAGGNHTAPELRVAHFTCPWASSFLLRIRCDHVGVLRIRQKCEGTTSDQPSPPMWALMRSIRNAEIMCIVSVRIAILTLNHWSRFWVNSREVR